jgi:hypothetical protein
MHDQPPCFPASVLLEFVEGKVFEPQLSELARHLETCVLCQGLADTLSPSDNLVETLRSHAPAADRIAQTAPRLLIEKIKEIATVYPHHEAGRAFDFLGPPQTDDELGRLDHYRVTKLLGRGGMGLVFQAEDTRLGRQVALKVMSPRLAADPSASARFLREARATAKLHGDRIATVFEVGQTATGIPYLAMELLAGQSLADWLLSGDKPTTAQIVHIAREIALGLAEAHDCGLVHRDIKPGNLWMQTAADGTTRIKLLDFGLVRARLDDSHTTHAGALLGTPAFMAPEQARGDRTVDGRADLFSLGCVLYLLCTGEVPFRGETTIGTLMSLAMNEPVPPAQCNPAIPRALSKLVMQLLEKDVARRPQSAREVLRRLDEIDGRKPNVASAQSNRRWPLAAAVIAVGFAALAAAATILFWQTPDGRVLRIECNDPAIEIAFGDGELQVTGAYKQPIVLKPGKASLRIARELPGGDRFEFETDKLVVAKGDNIVLNIEVLDGQVNLMRPGQGVIDAKPLPAPATANLVSADADRLVAKWVLGLGGKVMLSDGVWRESEAALPSGELQVVESNLRRIAALRDEELGRLAELKSLARLYLDNTSISNAGVAHLANLRSLRWLDLSNTRITDEGLAHLDNLPSLETLYLDSTAITNAGLKHIVRHKRLQALVLAVTQVTDEGLPELGSLTDLTFLSLHRTAITDAGLPHLAPLVELRTLDLSYTALSDRGLVDLAKLKHLQTLHLRAPAVTDTGLGTLAALKELKQLDITGTRVTRLGVQSLAAALPDCRIESDWPPLTATSE